MHEAGPRQVMYKLPLHDCILLSVSFPHLVSAVQLYMIANTIKIRQS